MEYITVAGVVFLAIGMRAFQQKVIQSNLYLPMGVVGGLIYLMEGAAILAIANGGYYHVISGAVGAGSGVVCFVYLYNRLFTKSNKNVKKDSAE